MKHEFSCVESHGGSRRVIIRGNMVTVLGRIYIWEPPFFRIFGDQTDQGRSKMFFPWRYAEKSKKCAALAPLPPSNVYYDWLVVTGTMEFYDLVNHKYMVNKWKYMVNIWNFMIFHSVGNMFIPTDFHSIIFQRGRLKNHQPDDY